VVKWRSTCGLVLSIVLLHAAPALGQQAGSIRGVVHDQDFNRPVAGAQILIAETKQKTASRDDGTYAFGQVPPGRYTVVFSKEGLRVLAKNVAVLEGQMMRVDVEMTGEFEELPEFVVQDLAVDATSTEGLLQVRAEAPSFLNTIGSLELDRAGAGDAAAALTLVPGATVQDGKYPSIRGFSDRYVNTKLTGVRLPTADAEKLSVELDQFPSDVIGSIRVSKTFTPDQQGDASAGTVDVVLKGIPVGPVQKLSFGSGMNTQTANLDDFLTFKGGAPNFWGMDNRPIPANGAFDLAVGTSRKQSPFDHNWSFSMGDRFTLGSGVKVGGFSNFYYKRDSSFFDNGRDDSYVARGPGPMTPAYSQGSPALGEFKTSLFDITQGSEKVQWGWLGTLGIEGDYDAVNLIYIYTRVAEAKATLAEDTRGKAYYYPGYDPNDPSDPGNQEPDAAPYIRNETLAYTERTTQMLQLNGHHVLIDPELQWPKVITFLPPEVDWTVAHSSATMDQPDKRQFGELWHGARFDPGFPPWVPPFTDPAVHLPNKAAALATLGNLQRVWKDITEESDQYFIDVKFPFKQWSGNEGYLKLGLFNDEVSRTYNQDSFSNFNDAGAGYQADWEEHWSEVFPYENHPLTAGNIDVDYDGQRDISAWYYMVDLPLCSFFKVIGGVRYENTNLSIVNHPEADVTWVPPGASLPIKLNPGDADVTFEQSDILPSLGFVLMPHRDVTIRGSYSETVARQTFKEMTPIQQMEYLGGPVFIGNPNLKMSALKNYDLRVDYAPYPGGLVSASYFFKDVTDPIEYVQKDAGFGYRGPENYPEGWLQGVELEVRHEMGRTWKPLQGLTVGANATFIESEVTLPAAEAARFGNLDMSTRPMTNAPEHLFNFNMTYSTEHLTKDWATQLGLFYTVRGDTLVAGVGGSAAGFTPSIYEAEYGTLNFSVIQKLGKHWRLKFQAKNLTNPQIQEIYRSKYILDDVVKSSYRKGIDLSIGISAEFNF